MLRRIKLVIASMCAIHLATAAPLMVDVFANVNGVDTKINNINQNFESAGIYAKYNISPLISNHKVHLTLYLTEYDDSQISNIESTVATLAKNTTQFAIRDKAIALKASNFLMLDVENNLELQILADKITANLMNYRDKNAVIPAWAKSDPLKSTLFASYGSPSVFDGFNPHFSIFVAKIAASDQDVFNTDINNQIKRLNFTPTQYQVTDLGIAITDKDGQIIKLLHTYPLQLK